MKERKREKCIYDWIGFPLRVLRIYNIYEMYMAEIMNLTIFVLVFYRIYRI